MSPRFAFLVLLALIFTQGGCTHSKAKSQKAVDEGYLLGASDTVKRTYWLKQALEQRAGESDEEEIYYTLFEEEDEDPQHKVPHAETRKIRE